MIYMDNLDQFKNFMVDMVLIYQNILLYHLFIILFFNLIHQFIYIM